jgi:hypothetical protein
MAVAVPTEDDIGRQDRILTRGRMVYRLPFLGRSRTGALQFGRRSRSSAACLFASRRTFPFQPPFLRLSGRVRSPLALCSRRSRRRAAFSCLAISGRAKLSA